MTEWTAEYKKKMRAFMASKGQKVDVQEKRWEWEQDDEANVYGWVDYDAQAHVKEDPGCSWIVPAGAKLYERTYSQFTDTFHDNDDEVGINIRGCHCACGKYTDVILRYRGSLAEVVRELTGTPGRAEIEL